MRPRRLSRQSPEEALESLYRLHLREIFGYALALLGSPADAEDATQATFLNAYRALQQGERPRHAATWLRAIALNVCREHFRRESRKPAAISLDEDPGELVDEPQGPPIGDVIRALSHLPFNQRSALVMREFEGRSLADIAQRLDVTSSAVETLLFRARRALREQLDASLRCDEAEQAISRQLDGALPRSERGALRAHLRECPECASLARRLRAQRSTLRSLALVPVPASLVWSKLAPPVASSGGSVAAASSVASAGVAGVAVKTAGGAILAALAVGAGYAALRHQPTRASVRGVAVAARPRVTKHTRSLLLPADTAPATRARETGVKPGQDRAGHATAGRVRRARAARVSTAGHGAASALSASSALSALSRSSASTRAQVGGSARRGAGHATNGSRARGHASPAGRGQGHAHRQAGQKATGRHGPPPGHSRPPGGSPASQIQAPGQGVSHRHG